MYAELKNQRTSIPVANKPGRRTIASPAVRHQYTAGQPLAFEDNRKEHAAQAAIQRKVTNYSVSSEGMVEAPRDQLKRLIDPAKFTNPPATIFQNIDKWTNIYGNVKIWNRVKATIHSQDGEQHPPRSGIAQNIVGLLGKDEYMIKTGDIHAFEGGHIIPLSVWGSNDTKAGAANDYQNLVPMSRTLNINGWAAAESRMKDGTKKNWDIKIDRENYEVPYGAIAQNFFLTLNNPGADRQQTVYMNGISPLSIIATSSGSSIPSIGAETGTIRPANRMITTGAELKAFLASKKGWEYLSDAMQGRVNAIP